MDLFKAVSEEAMAKTKNPAGSGKRKLHVHIKLHHHHGSDFACRLALTSLPLFAPSQIVKGGWEWEAKSEGVSHSCDLKRACINLSFCARERILVQKGV